MLDYKVLLREDDTCLPGATQDFCVCLFRSHTEKDMSQLMNEVFMQKLYIGGSQ